MTYLLHVAQIAVRYHTKYSDILVAGFCDGRKFLSGVPDSISDLAID